jgi:hypothetical protein
VSYSVTIIRNSDGERATISHDGDWDEGAEFIWSEGNYSCDCNRAIFFARERDEPDPWPPCECGKVPAECKCQHPPCGDTLFSVILPTELSCQA